MPIICKTYLGTGITTLTRGLATVSYGGYSERGLPSLSLLVVKRWMEDPGELGVNKYTECDTFSLQCRDTAGCMMDDKDIQPVKHWVSVCLLLTI